jgi:toxin-antitoxin system PIN domain toxin
MQKTALLDVNVLIALLDQSHQHHEAAHRWFAGRASNGWATCPITQNGCIRIMSGPSYPAVGNDVSRIRALLIGLTRIAGHQFWADGVSLLDDGLFDLAAIRSARTTDVYLLGLAVRRNGFLVTFDRQISLASVSGASAASLEVLTT